MRRYALAILFFFASFQQLAMASPPSQPVVTEVVHITVKAGMESLFEQAVKKAELIFDSAKGCQGIRLFKVYEKPGDYRLMVHWETIEDHLSIFRNSDGYQKWREMIVPYLAAPSWVEHLTPVAQ